MRIDAPCLDCGEPVRVEIRDGSLLDAQPQATVAYVAVPFWKWFQDAPFA